VGDGPLLIARDEGEEPARVQVRVVLPLDERAPLAAERRAERLVAREARDRVRERDRVVRRGEEPGLAVAHELRHAGHRAADDRPARRHRLHERGRDAVHVAGAVAAAGHDERVAGTQLLGDLLLRDGRAERHVLGEPEAGDLRAE